MEECASCHRVIGDLETPKVFNEQVVCAECDARLRPGRVVKFNHLVVVAVGLLVIALVTSLAFHFLSASRSNLPSIGGGSPSPSRNTPPTTTPAPSREQKLAVFWDQRRIDEHQLGLVFLDDLIHSTDGIPDYSIEMKLKPMMAKVREAVFNELEQQDDQQIKLALDRGDDVDAVIKKYAGKPAKNAEQALKPPQDSKKGN